MKMIAQGNSMYPTMIEGNEYELSIKSQCEICLGDVIVYKYKDIYICHRIVKIIKSRKGEVFYKTQGDNCLEPDPCAVRSSMIIGVVNI